MEEVEMTMLPSDQQVSDDFDLMYDAKEKKYYAVRAPNQAEKLAFCLEANSKEHAIAKAVNAIAAYLEGQKPEMVGFVPAGWSLHYNV